MTTLLIIIGALFVAVVCRAILEPWPSRSAPGSAPRVGAKRR
jgi:hypothetical protein